MLSIKCRTRVNSTHVSRQTANDAATAEFMKVFYTKMNRVCLLYDDGPTSRRIEPLLIFTDVEVPVGIEVAAQV